MLHYSELIFPIKDAASAALMLIKPTASTRQA
jgi:hypothetical protein